MNTKSKLVIGILFLAAGVLLGSNYLTGLLEAANDHPIAGFVTNSATVVKTSTGVPITELYPVHILVPSVSVSLNIDPGYYDYSKNTWTLSDTRANFAVVSAVPNTESGDTYIYGHNRDAVFGKMNNIKLGSEAVIANASGQKFTYKLAGIKDLSPSDLTYIRYSGKPIMTVQICHGLWDQYRRLYIFDFEGMANA